ncbi:HEC/Ndc80p family-domain-containing protein [Cantharellus anzutake]|uniref:HEC/Ndc80p family-domain-containing protein n=1 Tax=Cantharellus anzutake TaxID=1750568 RepID=UPI00190671B4|nr:HEC/Ndc80p family-domain-containing protein [Cantharellus anzutake]KAF8316496.1 HEC/Ndc80p family-domain-containing protein [Cantharellus anzutake]
MTVAQAFLPNLSNKEHPTTATSNLPSSLCPRKSNFGLPGIVQTRPPPGSSASTLGRSHLGPPPQTLTAPSSSLSQRIDYGKTPIKSDLGSSAINYSALGTSSVRKSNAPQQPHHSLRPARAGIPSSSSSGHKETRPIRDKSYQLIEQREILDYLISIEMNLILPTLSLKTLQSPSTREFIEIWKRLVEELDPDYVYPVVEPEKGSRAVSSSRDKESVRTMPEEFIQVMKDLRYPLIDTISKQSLQAPSAPHAWQSILACLHWMVQQAKIKARWLSTDSQDLYVLPSEALTLNPEDERMANAPELRHLIEFRFYAETYDKWWGDEEADFEAEQMRMVEEYNLRTEGQEEAIEQMDAQIDKLRTQLEKLRSKERPLQLAETERAEIISRIKTFKKGMEDARSKRKRISDAVEDLEENIEETSCVLPIFSSASPTDLLTRHQQNDAGKEVNSLLAERADLHSQIKAQKMTEVEISQMFSDAETLQKQNATLNEKLAQAKQALHENEVTLARRVDSVEEDIAVYTTLLEKVGLVGGGTSTSRGKDAENRNGVGGSNNSLPKTIQNVEFRIELNMARGDPSSNSPSEAMLVPGASPANAIAPVVDLRRLIKPALGEYRKATTAEMQRITGEVIEIEHEIEEVEGKIEDVRERIESCEEERALTIAQIESMKQKMADEAENAREANNQLEKAARDLEDELSQGTGAALAKRKNLEIEYEAQRANILKVKDEIKSRIIEASSVLSSVVEDCGALLQELEVAAETSDARTAKFNLALNG